MIVIKIYFYEKYNMSNTTLSSEVLDTSNPFDQLPYPCPHILPIYGPYSASTLQHHMREGCKTPSKRGRRSSKYKEQYNINRNNINEYLDKYIYFTNISDSNTKFKYTLRKICKKRIIQFISAHFITTNNSYIFNEIDSQDIINRLSPLDLKTKDLDIYSSYWFLITTVLIPVLSSAITQGYLDQVRTLSHMIRDYNRVIRRTKYKSVAIEHRNYTFNPDIVTDIFKTQIMDATTRAKYSGNFKTYIFSKLFISGKYGSNKEFNQVYEYYIYSLNTLDTVLNVKGRYICNNIRLIIIEYLLT